ncbi:MAG: PTS sugar transporter subunit IIA [Gammaproteobacteria bacterium]|nr:PTS sugar transporter subunit IIA [Gammaproteobacteria bacterium]
MNLDTLISSNAVIINSEIKSKKRALELLAETLAEEAVHANKAAAETSQQDDDTNTESTNTENIKALGIFQLLLDREKLGSTSMGHGVALPHARTALTEYAIGAFLKLDKGIDFDSPDNQPTDLIFALLVPEHYTDEHLKILAYLASLFSDESFCKSIRNTSSNTEIYHHLVNWQLTSQAS